MPVWPFHKCVFLQHVSVTALIFYKAPRPHSGNACRRWRSCHTAPNHVPAGLLSKFPKCLFSTSAINTAPAFFLSSRLSVDTVCTAEVNTAFVCRQNFAVCKCSSLKIPLNKLEIQPVHQELEILIIYVIFYFTVELSTNSWTSLFFSCLLISLELNIEQFWKESALHNTSSSWDVKYVSELHSSHTHTVMIIIPEQVCAARSCNMLPDLNACVFSACSIYFMACQPFSLPPFFPLAHSQIPSQASACPGCYK